MDFFKSILLDDPDPETMDSHRKSNAEGNPNHQQTERAETEYTNSNSTSSGEVSGNIAGRGGLWSFGDLMKTLTTTSESVLETYRRDLKEFGSGLRKESDLFREVANRAVRDLPTSIEIGASAIDGVVKSTADIISQGKHVAILEPSDVDDSDASESIQNSRVYSRFDSQLNAIQTDSRTYCDDPDDLDDYNKWKLGFVLSDREEEIENLIGENGSVEAIYRKIVPNQVDDASFWCRYFFRVYKLKQQEDIRAHLVRRSLTVDDEEELSWDIDDDEGIDLPKIETRHISKAVESDNLNNNSVHALKIDQIHENSDIAGNDCVDDKQILGEPRLSDGGVSESKVELEPKLDDKLNCEKNAGQDLQEDEDLEWDEIGDVGDDEEKHVSQGETVMKGELFKRVQIGEDDEDLNWDIEEDDDEPLKNSSKR